MNDDHNRYDCATLERVIESIRDHHGKASCRLVAERIGRPLSSTWHLLVSSGLPTRLYSMSLKRIEQQIRTQGAGLTLTELYEQFGSSWANPGSFHQYLMERGIKPVRAPRRTTTPNTPAASLSSSKLTTPAHPIFGREGLLDDTKKTDVELRLEAKIQAEQINNNPTKLYKFTYMKNQHKL